MASSDLPYDSDKARMREVRRSRERRDREPPFPDDRETNRRRSRSPGEYSSPVNDHRQGGKKTSRSRSRSPSARDRPLLILEDVPLEANENDVSSW
jgi:hypothetical protein